MKKRTTKNPNNKFLTQALGWIDFRTENSRGEEMSLSRFLVIYYELPKSDLYAVYLLPAAIYLLQCCLIAANIVWAGLCVVKQK